MTATLFEDAQMEDALAEIYRLPRLRVIGLTGRAGSGKDTVGTYLVEKHGFTRFAYADALKEAALAINPLIFDNERLQTLVEVHGMDFVKRAYPEARRFLQELGLAIRTIDPAFWLYPLDRLIRSGERRIVVTDCRFDNEAAQIDTELGGAVFQVERPGAGLTGAGADHASERGVSREYLTNYIFNTGGIADLHAEIEYIMQDYLN